MFSHSIHMILAFVHVLCSRTNCQSDYETNQVVFFLFSCAYRRVLHIIDSLKDINVSKYRSWSFLHHTFYETRACNSKDWIFILEIFEKTNLTIHKYCLIDVHAIILDTDNQRVIINMKDVNDEPPYFINRPTPMQTVVQLNAPPNTHVFTLQAKDPDTDSKIHYYIVRDRSTYMQIFNNYFYSNEIR